LYMSHLYSFPTRRSSDLCLKIFFKHLIRRYLSIGINIGRVGVLFELAVLQSQARNDLRVVVAAVAGEARYARLAAEVVTVDGIQDRKSTRLNSSHVSISY